MAEKKVAAGSNKTSTTNSLKKSAPKPVKKAGPVSGKKTTSKAGSAGGTGKNNLKEAKKISFKKRSKSFV